MVSGNTGFWASVDDGQNVKLSPTRSIGEEFSDAHLIRLFIRRFRRGRGGEFLEARIRLPPNGSYGR